MNIKRKILSFFKKFRREVEDKKKIDDEEFPLPKPDPIPNPNPQPL
jgi:hypothetical protein